MLFIDASALGYKYQYLFLHGVYRIYVRSSRLPCMPSLIVCTCTSHLHTYCLFAVWQDPPPYQPQGGLLSKVP